ncbi:DUF1433 domain-containing protein [Bacillus thuringiensis]|uniref:DUF1433 domain-containing protein n=1 Tax=Bacillus thuringiensis TaxID=1428 RepID=A0AB36TLD8_BACTU|nr:DUF1433 domain-containing protein [Bacillus thuringiensis]PEE66270.1 DUF1433 domain-containing protein [Bacillus thuringiensis]PEE88592.1 DUF1433 domain-containing protein [Bacillus thuringiensis]PFM84229.1 DUF1433 domain-containing protein [Bacillus thuringiensis]
MKKNGIRLFIILTLILLGGCGMNNKTNEEKEIVDKATEKTINYFKEKQNLDVTITDYRFPSNDLESVFITGHIKDDESKEFTATIDYNNNYNVGSVSTNFSLKK